MSTAAKELKKLCKDAEKQGWTVKETSDGLQFYAPDGVNIVIDRYLSEFAFRHSTRDLSDAERMQRIIGRAGGRRLTYKPRSAEA